MKIACAGVSVTGSAGQMVTPHAARMPLLVLHAAELAEELGQSFSRRLVVKTGRVVWNNWLLLQCCILPSRHWFSQCPCLVLTPIRVELMKLRAAGEFSSALMAETVELLLLLQRRTSPVITVGGGVATTRYRLRALTSSSSDWRRSRSEMTVIPVHCLSQHLRVKTLASHNFRSPPPPSHNGAASSIQN